MNPTLAPSPDPLAPEASPPEPDAAPGRSCTHCGAALADGQGWCLECGAAAPGALRSRVPARAGLILLALTGVLVVGAAGAAYAALSTPSKKILVAGTPTATPPAADAPGPAAAATSPPTGPTAATPPPVTPPVKAVTPTVPKVTAPTVTPTTPAITTQAPGVTPPPVVAPPVTTTSQSSSTETASGPTPLLLDSDATSDYNPNNLSEQNFGDPSLAIDGDTTTSWSAQVPTVPLPGGDAGLLIDLRSPQKLASLHVVTDTPGATFVVLGATGAQAPATIAGPGWTELAAPHAVKGKLTFTLATKGHHYRWLVLWILGVKGHPVSSLAAAAASVATTSTLSDAALSTTSTTTTTSTSTSTSTSSSTTTTNTSPLATVDVNELTVYP